MPDYRVTIRYGSPRHRYAVVDVEADGLKEALTAVVTRFPEEALDGDLVEVRRRTAPEEREFGPG